MHVRFLLGPAGSGKTSCCLEEIRTELRASPEGPPLLLLAPKQVTFQLERQLLATPDLAGYTRLRITSLDRLGADLLQESVSALQVLSEDGRVMVLRALLARHHSRLRLFHATARLPGFARQLSLTLRDAQRHQAGPERLRRAAARCEADPTVAGKLLDCAFLLEAYEDWIQTRQLHDPDALLDEASRIVRGWSRRREGSRREVQGARISGLWLDGFAELTPQEVEFLAALVPHCAAVTLALCLPGQSGGYPASSSPWSVVGHTYGLLLARLCSLPGVEIDHAFLPSDPGHSRFAANPVLAHLERYWTKPVPYPAESPQASASGGGLGGQGSAPQMRAPVFGAGPLCPGSRFLALRSALRLAVCRTPDAEALLAAREILAHVRAGGRFREVAILLRSLDHHQAALQRTFRRYGIPFFLDRRESVAHHPLAELTRYALRTLAFGWRHEDWFGALKTGLLPAEPDEIDLLENTALAWGWEGSVWQQPLCLPEAPDLSVDLEAIRHRVVPPLSDLARRLDADAPQGHHATGLQLAEALTEFWTALGVADRLQAWSEAAPDLAGAGRVTTTHQTVWNQMQAWADDLALAFADTAQELREWLPIVESGLAGLTVGVVPPALDQVLIGTVDRSRNPDLELAIVLGVNDRVFPATPRADGLLTEADRQAIEFLGLTLGPDRRTRLAQERYLAYIAFTRARRRVVVSCCERDANDEPCLPSVLFQHLIRLFPDLAPEPDFPSADWRQAVHPIEVAVPYLAARIRHPTGPGLAMLPDLLRPEPLRDTLDRLAGWYAPDTLSPDIATRLGGPVLGTSVSALETYAACPFRFFVATGLSASERQFFEADAREHGSFQHEVLARFHAELEQDHRRWRDLSAAEARERIGRLGAEVASTYRAGLFQSRPETRFTARALTVALQDFIEVAVGWMASYGFDPAAVELAFGRLGDPLPPWSLDLGEGRRLELRGRIDRVDLGPSPASGVRSFVVIDYKSSARTLDPLRLEHGLQIQLPVYLTAVRALTADQFAARALQPAGAFFVNLRGHYDSAAHRGEVLDRETQARRAAYQHRGRFRLDALPALDCGAPHQPSGQFYYRLTKAGAPYRNCPDPLEGAAFDALLDRVEVRLCASGRAILNGCIRVDPYRHGSETACDTCEFRAICRIDPWTHTYRRLDQPELRPPSPGEAPDA